VRDDVLHHHDGVVDHQADGGGQSAQRHQVEGRAGHLRAMNVTATVAGITIPATSEVPQSRRNSTRMTDARISPIRMASRALPMAELTISTGRKTLQFDVLRQRLADGFDFGVHLLGHRDRIAVGLPVDVQQDGRLAVGGDHGVDRLDGVQHRADVPDANRQIGRRRFDDDVGNLGRRAGLAADKSENKLMISLHQPGRIHHVALGNRVEDVGHGDGGLDHPSRVQANLELGLLPAWTTTVATPPRRLRRGFISYVASSQRRVCGTVLEVRL